jgi:hypothetical protein
MSFLIRTGSWCKAGKDRASIRTRCGGSWLDPMSLLEERDHLVTGLAAGRSRRCTVIAPRSASMQILLS